jgi:hypothetical protein
VRNYSRVAALERALENSGGELPEFEGTAETTSRDVIETLVESGVLVESGDGGYSVERNSNAWEVGKGDEGLSQALNSVLSGGEVDWVEGHPVTGEGAQVNGTNLLEYSDQYANTHRGIYNDTHNQLNYDKGNIEDLYSRHQ